MSGPKFRTKDGWNTVYALACGYQDRYETGVRYTSEEVIYKHKPLTGVSVTLWAEGGYHVRAHNYDANERICWETFNTLREARQAFTAAKRLVNKLHPTN